MIGLFWGFSVATFISNIQLQIQIPVQFGCSKNTVTLHDALQTGCIAAD